MLGNHFSNLRNQLSRDFHHGVFVINEGSFVFCQSFIFRLLLIMVYKPFYAFFVPTFGKFVFIFHFRRLIRRKAISGFP